MKHHLLGYYDSPYVRRVAIAMAWYGIDFEHQSLSVFRHVEVMRELNPLLRVPLLTTPDGQRLHESAYILDYLDELIRERGGTALIPASGPQRQRILQQLALAQAAVDKAVAINYERRRPDALRWPEWEARLREQMTTAFGLLEAGLDRPDNGYLAGDGPTHADVMAAVGVSFTRYTDRRLMGGRSLPLPRWTDRASRG